MSVDPAAMMGGNGNTPENRYNLPGQRGFLPGNPGKPKGTRHMTTKIMEAIMRVSEDGGSTEDVQIVRALVKKAKEGDVAAVKLIINYTDGMPPQDIDVTSGGQPFTVVTRVPDGNNNPV